MGLSAGMCWVKVLVLPLSVRAIHRSIGWDVLGEGTGSNPLCLGNGSISWDVFGEGTGSNPLCLGNGSASWDLLVLTLSV